MPQAGKLHWRHVLHRDDLHARHLPALHLPRGGMFRGEKVRGVNQQLGIKMKPYFFSMFTFSVCRLPHFVDVQVYLLNEVKSYINISHNNESTEMWQSSQGDILGDGSRELLHWFAYAMLILFAWSLERCTVFKVHFVEINTNGHVAQNIQQSNQKRVKHFIVRFEGPIPHWGSGE